MQSVADLDSLERKQAYMRVRRLEKELWNELYGTHKTYVQEEDRHIVHLKGDSLRKHREFMLQLQQEEEDRIN